MTPTGNILEFNRVSFAYPESGPVLQECFLTMKPGCFAILSGPSGSGKSTLLRLINRLEEPDSGEILFQGRPLKTYAAPHLRRSLMYIQQTPTVVSASIRHNLLLPFTFKHNRDYRPPDDNELEAMLESFLLEDLKLTDNALTLSVGQLQRICFIRGLLLSPEVLLLDEPTSALDEKSARVVEAQAEKLCRDGLTVLMICHRRFIPAGLKPVRYKLTGARVTEES